MFLDNDEVVERRNLFKKLGGTESRLRACENILAAATQEKVKFMEGASWAVQKVMSESEIHSSKVHSMVNELKMR